MTHIRWEAAEIQVGIDRWAELETLMSEAGDELGSASVGGLAPSVQGAATSFLTAWKGYAGESEAIAEGFTTALRDSLADVGNTDEAQAEGYGQLDGRLGAAR